MDLGLKRIGLAVLEAEFGVATPRPALAAAGKLETDAVSVSDKARTEKVDGIVLGVPLDDVDPRMGRVCARFADLLRARGWTVHTVDESFTSVQADAAMAAAGLKGSERRKRKDGEAACAILERFAAGEGARAETEGP